MSDELLKEYNPLPTMREFHRSGEQIRCIVGPVGSGKTSAAAWEVCYYLPHFLAERHNIKKTRWLIVRNTYAELRDTTQKTVFEWFPFGEEKKQRMEYVLHYPEGIEVEILFRSCDRPEDMKKFKSLEITGYWIDESIEVSHKIKRMLKNRIGRFPPKCPARFGIETTNPPDVEDPTYWQFSWNNFPPGPATEKEPLKNHSGFWQPPNENKDNLRPGYYEDLRKDYIDNPDWIDVYIEGKPGVIIQGKSVYNNFDRQFHESTESLAWTKGKLYCGWDNSGNIPACAVIQIPSPMQAHVLAEFTHDRMGIVDFGNYVNNMMSMMFPGYEAEHWGDPAGEAKYSKPRGGLTSNAELMRNECGIDVQPSEQNLIARIESVDKLLARIKGLLIDPRCRKLINGFLGGYHYPESRAVPGQYGPTIVQNKYAHIHSALQYVIVKLFPSLPLDERLRRERKGHDFRRNRDDDERRSKEYDHLTYRRKRKKR